MILVLEGPGAILLIWDSLEIRLRAFVSFTLCAIGFTIDDFTLSHMIAVFIYSISLLVLFPTYLTIIISR